MQPMDCLIRIATNGDAAAISQVVVRSLRESNAQDYSPEIIDQVEQSFSPTAILHLLIQRQVYVATIDDHVVATASLDRDIVRSVFVDPASQGAGIGRQLMAMIQSIAVNKGVKLLRVPSSITAEGFYSALGFKKIRDEFHGAERTIIMEKSLDQ
jgi:N-acetylglutamate synthase-like GNAT family acetyltransferase